MNSFRTLFWLFVASGCLAQQAHPPLTQREACAQYADAVVRVDAGGQSRGTGFIVSPDGFVLTAAHVITGDGGQYFSVITVKLSDGSVEFAKPAIPATADNVGQDFALLKVEGKSNLAFLALGSVQDVEVGTDAAIIGYPFSAVSVGGKNVAEKFCLSAVFAAKDLVTVPVEETNNTAKGINTLKKDVKVDVVYFQGPSVKGVSGSPIISRDTGRVVGIVTAKLTGIGKALLELKQQTERGAGTGLDLGGLNPGVAVNQIITVLDNQLANGLGAATGIDDPKDALKQAQRKMKPKVP